MSGLLSRATSDSRFQLAATALLSGGIVAAGLLSYQRLSHEQRVSRLKNSIPNPSDDHTLQKVSKHPHQQPRCGTTQNTPKHRPEQQGPETTEEC